MKTKVRSESGQVIGHVSGPHTNGRGETFYEAIIGSVYTGHVAGCRPSAAETEALVRGEAQAR